MWLLLFPLQAVYLSFQGQLLQGNWSLPSGLLNLFCALCVSGDLLEACPFPTLSKSGQMISSHQ